MKILGIESSCDDTSVAITDNGKLLANVVSSQIKNHIPFGGVVPEIASRLHSKNIIYCLEKALVDSKVKLDQIDAVAVTRGPGLIGCLHIGLIAAKTICSVYKIPLIPVHHLAGHIYANEFVTELKFPLISLIISGGNTEFVYMKEDMDFKILGETRDDAVGECFDKAARILGLPYPGGIQIQELAKKGKPIYKFPIPLNKSNDFSFSGLKTSVLNLVNKMNMKKEKYKKEDICRSFEEVIVDILITKSLDICKQKKIKQFILGGGVSANSWIRDKFEKEFAKTKIDFVVPPLWTTGDNASMIAKFGEHLYKKKIFAPLDISPDPTWDIEDFKKF